MGISELRQLDTQDLEFAGPPNDSGLDLVQAGIISRSDAALAQIVGKYCDASVDRILEAEGLASEADLLAAHAKRAKSSVLGFASLKRQVVVPDDVDPRSLLKRSVAVTAKNGRPFQLATCDLATVDTLRNDLPDGVKGLPAVFAPRQEVQTAVADHCREFLTEAAQSRVPEVESCRTWPLSPHRRLLGALIFLSTCVYLTFLAPSAVFAVFIGWATFTLFVSAGMKSAAFIARMTVGDPTEVVQPTSRTKKLPKVSVLVPLFKETEIAHALIKRLSRLTYPKCLLDVVLILEEKDDLTQQTLAEIDLPPWMRAIIVPDGQPRTKPRAMNYALDFCEGDIIGIFDAEDAPDPDQITAVARRFQAAPPEVACLQGILDYYNPKRNWLARCFTIEYATWFRTVLPGMARLGFAIPLGGTTLYFRRDILEELGGWDAHNVTEDADLGFRLARHGYRTEIIGTVTGEEANCRAWPWVKQRSRWLKGYMTTYLVHMRHPRLLYRQLGATMFWGFQAHFITALSQFFLAPFLWSFWLICFGLPHPLDPYLPRATLLTFTHVFLAVEVLNIAIYTFSVSGKLHRHLMIWTPTMHLYTPLGTIAAYKALYEMIFAPFYWDKTSHGHSLETVAAKVSDDSLDLAGVQLETRNKRF